MKEAKTVHRQSIQGMYFISYKLSHRAQLLPFFPMAYVISAAQPARLLSARLLSAGTR